MKRKNFTATIDLTAYENFTEQDVRLALITLLNSNASTLDALNIDVKKGSA